jgi:hypothetical protein
VAGVVGLVVVTSASASASACGGPAVTSRTATTPPAVATGGRHSAAAVEHPVGRLRPEHHTLAADVPRRRHWPRRLPGDGCAARKLDRIVELPFRPNG